MNRAEYEEHLKTIRAAACCACDKHGLKVVEMVRKEEGVECPKCGWFVHYEKLLHE